MKKFSRVLLLVLVLAFVLCTLGVSALAAEDYTAITHPQLYIGNYDTSTHSGQAHIIFATVSDTSKEYGVIITQKADGLRFKFEGKAIGPNGKFGIAIYYLPDGDYTVEAYSGAEDARTFGEAIPFTKGVSSYTVTYDLAGGEADYSSELVAQGSLISEPVAPEKDGYAFSGWLDSENEYFDFESTRVHENLLLTANWVKASIPVTTKSTTSTVSGVAGKMGFGTKNVVDLSDGSTLNLEMDVIDAYMPQTNYNAYIELRQDTAFSVHSARYYTFAYANWAYGLPWAGHYVAQNNITLSSGIDLGTNWDPNLWFAKNQSVKFSYTAPTATSTGSICVYVKHIDSPDENYKLVSSITGLLTTDVQNTSKVIMGVWFDEGSARYITHMNLNAYVERVNGKIERDCESFLYLKNDGTANAKHETVENTYAPAVIAQDGVEYNYRYDDSDGTGSVDQGGSFKGWFGNVEGVNLDKGESLTMEFTVDSVRAGNWYNVWSGFTVYSSAGFAASNPQSGLANSIAFYGNFALGTSSYAKRYATISGDSKCTSGTSFESGYANFDPYTDIVPSLTSANTVRVVYTSPSDDSTGSFVLYRKGVNDTEWTKVTSIVNITTTAIQNNVHIAWQHNSSQNNGSSYDYKISGLKFYTSNGKTSTVLGVGGDALISYIEEPEIKVNEILFDKSEIDLYAGQSDKINATIAPYNAENGKLIWTSSNESVAKVDQTGKVTAIGAGDAIITATSANGVTAQCAVQVEAAMSISLNVSELILFTGWARTPQATVTPDSATDKTITWTSTNTSVASVDASGSILGIKAGESVVRATIADGHYAEIAVSVYDRIVVTLDKTATEIKIGESDTIKATLSHIVPGHSGIQYLSSDESIATVGRFTGVITGVKAGKVTITAKADDGSTATCQVTVKNKYDLSFSLSNLTLFESGSYKTRGVPLTVDPDDGEQNITVESSDDSVATTWTQTSGGVFYVYAQANAPGQATITATASDGATASYVVTVYARTQITLSETELYIAPLEEIDIDYTLSQEVPNYKGVRFASSDVNIATVTSKGLIKGVGEGTVSITATTDDGTVATCTVHVSEDYIKYEMEDGNITALTTYGKTFTDLVIPASYRGVTVSGIAKKAFVGTSVQSLTIPSSITKIDDEAFRGVETLDTVTFDEGSNLTYVGDSAFRSCTALTDIVLPSSVTTVGELAFYGADQSGYTSLYSLNVQDKEYYAPKYTYEFMGEDVMPIGGYIEPSVGYLSVSLEEAIKNFTDSGTNMMIGIGQSRYGTTSAHYTQMLEYLEKYGAMMIMDGGSISSTYDGTWESMNQTMKDIYTYRISRYASYAGAHVEDEPGVSSFVPGILEYSKYSPDDGALDYRMDRAHLGWTEHYNRKLYFVNLLPINTPVKAIVWGAENYAYAPNTDNLWADYEQYADIDYYYSSYIDHVKPEVFSYDFYPLWANGTSNAYLSYPNLNGRHFEQLYKTHYYTTEYAQQSIGRQIPFWNFIQVTSWGNTTSGSRAATYNEVMWQINTALAFGSKGYQYFIFNDYGDITGEGGASGYGNLPMNIDGTKGEAYDDVTNANKQVQAMAKWLLNANLDHILVKGRTPNSETINSAVQQAKDSSFGWRLSSSSGQNNLVSYMKYYANNNDYADGVEGDARELYLVCNNTTNKGTSSLAQYFYSGKITVNFSESVTGSYIYNGVETAFSGSSLTVDTAPGEAFAILLDK